MKSETTKRAVEIALVSCQIDAVPEKRLLLSRHLFQLDLIWPRTGVAKKTAAREVVLKKGRADFAAEPWTKRTIFREEIDGHCGLAVSLTEALSLQKLRRFLRLTAKSALKLTSSTARSALIGYADIATAPLDALSTLVGEKDAPVAIAQGVVDYDALPSAGEERQLEIPLLRPLTGKPVGKVMLKVVSDK